MSDRSTVIAVCQSLIIIADEANEEILLTKSNINNLNDALKCIKKQLSKRKQFRKNCKRQQLYINLMQEYEDVSFQNHFRMSKSIFELLLQTLVQHNPLPRNYIPYNVQLLITLWLLATPDSFRSVGRRFNVNKGTAHFVYQNCIQRLFDLRTQFIVWPNAIQIKEIQKRIEQKSVFPGVCGFIDGTHIAIKPPEASSKYFNRKKFASLVLQAVCDDRMYFTDIDFGQPGSANDKRVYNESGLGNKMRENASELLGSNGHLLGDGGYTLSDHLLVPYLDNGHLLDEEIHFNNVLSSIRSTIERAFALLKEKWRRLKYLDTSNFVHLRNHVIASCVLHNFILQAGDTTDQDVYNPHPEDNESGLEGSSNSSNTRHQKRDRLAAYLYDIHFCHE